MMGFMVSLLMIVSEEALPRGLGTWANTRAKRVQPIYEVKVT